MKRSKFLVLGALAAMMMLVLAAPALADNGPHVMGAGLTPDTCAGCHRAHTAPAPHLLKQDGTQLCYTCHGASGTGSALDVEDGVALNNQNRPPTATVVGALRGGGFKFALIDSANPGTGSVPALAAGQATTSTHSVNSTLVDAWGNVPEGAASTPAYGTMISLRCASCHDPHGNGYYRILRPKPKEAGISRTSATNGGVGVLDVSTKTYTTTNYWASGDASTTLPAPAFTPPSPTAAAPTNLPFDGVKDAAGNVVGNAGISAWCATCHTRYLASYGNAATASGDPIFAYRHTSTGTGHAPTCAQCHVAHGTNASMGGPNSSQVGNPDPTDLTVGSSKLLRLDNRGVCQECHHK